MATYTEDEKKELEALRKKAELLGIAFSGNTSLKTLREKVEEVMGTAEEQEAKADEYQSIYDEKMRLIRCEVQCLDPMYRNAAGTFISLCNAVLGSHKYFVPFNTPIHITKWLYDYLKDCTYIDRSEKGKLGRDGRTHNKTVNTVRASYAIVDLPPLTEAELKALAEDQKLSGRLEEKQD